MPEKANRPGTNPEILQIALVNQSNLPKCNSESTKRILSFNVSGLSDGSRALKNPGNTKLRTRDGPHDNEGEEPEAKSAVEVPTGSGKRSSSNSPSTHDASS